MDSIRNPHPLVIETIETRDALALIGGHEQLLAKLNDLIDHQPWHGGMQVKAENLISQARLLLS
ncbi:hypothetical protein NVV94_05305 [Pseudomonas sp. LS1212]|uniref:hypothetical protein n=1 Tax=Pseudomonas sp. LS1212 TaxID=2972478 RepID=UPI00215C339D|nr:hypothetical protein [Pseudomonas sp. LS1212]UVJ45001.1 hypothetical protein NVV94_05305 [Pseudomonas sp. LS1212]